MIIEYPLYIMAYFAELVCESPVTGISAVVLALGALTRLVALFKPCKHIIWMTAGGATCVSFVLLLFLLLFANAMSAGPTPSIRWVDVLYILGGSVFVGGAILLCFYYWRFVWPICTAAFLAGLFFFGGIRFIKYTLF